MEGKRPRHSHALVVSLSLVAALAAASSAARAQDGAESAATAEWTIDDILFAESASQYRISPDGRWVVWVKTTTDKEKGRRISNLYLSSLTGDFEVQLTRGDYPHSSPRWSPSGNLISFMSTRPPPKKEGDAASSQLWLINPSGGEPWPLTSSERGIRSYEWKDDDTIIFTAQEDATLYERDTKKREDTSRVVEDAEHQPPVRMFVFSVGDKKVARLTDNDDWIRSFELSPDGRQAVVVHNRSLSYRYDQRVPPVTYLWDLEAGEGRELFDGSRIIPSDVQWAKDGGGFYMVNDSTTHPRYRAATINVMLYYDLTSGEANLVDLEWERGLGSSYVVTDDGFVALLADGVRFKPARYTRRGDGWRRSWIVSGRWSTRIQRRTHRPSCTELSCAARASVTRLA
jgi:dipeptidyl aminopeptidase/acylaminoacyl peptidase